MDMEQGFRRYCSDRDLERCGDFDGTGGYRSQWHQGLRRGMEWLRLSLEGVSAVRVQVFAAEEPLESWQEELEPALVGQGPDLILYGVRGRYLRFVVEPAEGLAGYTLSFPGRSIDAGLPVVLQDDPILRRFLAVYQSAYMDTNHQAARFPDRLDPRSAGALAELHLWVGATRWMRDAPCLPELLAAAPRLNRMRGTRRGLEWLVRLVTSGRGELVEEFQWREQPLNLEERAECARLYGGEAQVVVLLPADTNAAALRFLEQVVDDFIPLGLSCKLLQLRDGGEMDGHTYLDVNAQLREPAPPAMDESELDELILE